MCVCVRLFIVIFATLSSLTNDAPPNHRHNTEVKREWRPVPIFRREKKSGHIWSTRAKRRRSRRVALGNRWIAAYPACRCAIPLSVSGLSQRRSRAKFIPPLEIDVIHRAAAGDRRRMIRMIVERHRLPLECALGRLDPANSDRSMLLRGNRPIEPAQF